MRVAEVSSTQLVGLPVPKKKKILFKCNTHKPEIKSSHLRSEEIEMQRKVDEGNSGRGTRGGDGK